MTNVLTSAENVPAVKFIERNYHVLLFLAIIVAVVFLFVSKKTDQAIMLMVGYIIGQVANAKNIVSVIRGDRSVFEGNNFNSPSNTKQPETTGGSPSM
jgi:Na+/H+-translocating membrane pyrophosphatase